MSEQGAPPLSPGAGPVATVEGPKTRTVALVGNPNVGKSTLFNALTGARQQVANYPGVTVDARVGARGDLRFVDLPGVYGLRPVALDDAIATDLLAGRIGDAPETVVVVLDATNLRRNLFLLSEVADLELPTVVALNMADEARRAGLRVPREELERTLGVPVIETVATSGEGLAELLEALDRAKPCQGGWAFDDPQREALVAAGEGTRWARIERAGAQDPTLREQETLARYAWIGRVLAGAEDLGRPAERAGTERIDRVLLHPVLGPVLFLVVMGLLFQSIFRWAEPVMKLLEEGVIKNAQAWCNAHLAAWVGATLTSLVSDGVLAGVGAVVVFLPQIVILFLLLGLLEDTGYMARAAFLVDRPLRAVGLSGRSFIPLLSSFACAIPGILATRTIPSRRERLLSILIAPLMTCSARLPVYVLLIAAFVPDQRYLGWIGLRGLVLFGLYLSGMGAGIVLALLAQRGRQTRGRLLPLVVELPPYRRPSLRGVLLKLWVRAGDFLKRAGTVIFAVSVVLWVLTAFPRLGPQQGLDAKQQAAAQVEQSYAGRLGHAIEPLIRPLGYDWKIGVGLIGSFAAREVLVSTLGIVYAQGEEQDEESEGLRAALQRARHTDGSRVYSPATVASLLVFFVFALQCGSTVAVVRRETASWRFALAQLLGYLALAYVAALLTYQGMRACGLGV
ncbi:MAG: ferrous iron transport protein B [Planctomycetota bacterium]